jgi:hypothetical protein
VDWIIGDTHLEIDLVVQLDIVGAFLARRRREGGGEGEGEGEGEGGGEKLIVLVEPSMYKG